MDGMRVSRGDKSVWTPAQTAAVDCPAAALGSLACVRWDGGGGAVGDVGGRGRWEEGGLLGGGWLLVSSGEVRFWGWMGWDIIAACGR